MADFNPEEDKLIAGIIKGDLKTVENIINPLKISNPWFSGYRYLCLATDYLQDEIITYLLSKNTPVNNPTEKYLNSPLNLAVKSNKIHTVKKFLEIGAEIDKKNLSQQNSFDIALERGNLEILEILVDHITNSNISPESYLKLLADLLESSHHKLLEKLLKKCPEVDISAAMPAKNFLCIAVQKNYYPIVELLLKRNINVNSINYSRYGSQTALYIACRIGDSKMADLLLQNGASGDIKYDFYYSSAPKNVDQYNLYPIHIAIVYGYCNVVEVLLNNGEDCNKTYFTPYGTEYTALYLACEYHREEIVKLLVARGADVNFRDHRGYKPIFAAVSARRNANIVKEDYNIVECLVRNENIELDFVNMNAILTSAARRLDLDILELALKFEKLEKLVRYQLYVDLMKDRSVNSLPHLAIQFNKSLVSDQNFGKFVEIWATRGLDVNIKDQNGVTLLHKAFWYRHKMAAELLMEFGAEYNVCDKDFTPLDYAFKNKSKEDDDLEGFIEFVGQYFVKMKLLNVCVNKRDCEELICRGLDVKKYESEYEKEIEGMKKYGISDDDDDDDVTLYDFVTADLNKMVVLLKNEVVFETLKSEGYGDEFAQYKSLIRGRFYKALMRKKLLDEVDRFTVFNIIKKLPYPCMRKIMDCFCNSDLRDIINEYSLLNNS
ncbi:Similar to Ank3: Ankyrin-3 (Mus musculus) [Cotesia congregata]|uniref:Similar to Ank3: Ankyrin-3 (Mus musculus) n=1 Tax=Cotesia congregata TaxID=51543 RepID=A0A8J2EJ27_COTCN|nr:Similar to Ank3: Ankyrin-3 (Mus musculus) [Cotesia congregata]